MCWFLLMITGCCCWLRSRTTDYKDRKMIKEAEKKMKDRILQLQGQGAEMQAFNQPAFIQGIPVGQNVPV